MKAYSLADIYGLNASTVLPTTDQTIPEEEENQYYADNTTEDSRTGMKKVSSGNMVFGAIAVFVGVMVILHFIE